ncbi:MAG: GlmU family protein [Salibacteraceae bacterium]
MASITFESMSESKHIVLVDDDSRNHLFPITLTRPVSYIRLGIFTLIEKWRLFTGAEVSPMAPDYLAQLFPLRLRDVNLFVNAALIPEPDNVGEIIDLKRGEYLYDKNGRWVAAVDERLEADSDKKTKRTAKTEFDFINRNWEIFRKNDLALRSDWKWVTENRTSLPVPDGVTVIGQDIFVEEGAVLRPSIINTLEGPVYIGRHAEVMEGSLIRGAFALGDHSQLKMGAKIYGGTSIGPYCKVGGEVNNCVFIGYSNKGHDGFMGNSVVGEWCNIGADTNTSNLKNNYAPVKVFNYALNRTENTGSQFCGLTMGDHSKCGINTMFNTGTVCGIFANVFGSDFPHRRIPDFGWGGASGFKTHRLEDALDTAKRMMERRSVELTEAHVGLYTHLYNQLAENIR